MILHSKHRIPVIPPTQYVEMNVINDLSSATPHVENEFVPGLRNTLLGRYICGTPHEMAKKFGIRIARIRN